MDSYSHKFDDNGSFLSPPIKMNKEYTAVKKKNEDLLCYRLTGK